MDPKFDVPLLWEQPEQKQMMRCPWCEEWAPRDSFIALKTPPRYRPPRIAQVYKHGNNRNPNQCGMIFALGPNP